MSPRLHILACLLALAACQGKAGLPDHNAGWDDDADVEEFVDPGSDPSPADARDVRPVYDARDMSPDRADAADLPADPHADLPATPDADAAAAPDVLADTIKADEPAGADDDGTATDLPVFQDVPEPDGTGPTDAGPDIPGPVCDPPTGPLHVLFLGNSYTYVNDLPGMFRNLSTSGGIAVNVESIAYGGWTLGAPPTGFASDPGTLAKLAQGGLDVLVLQEQSQIPTVPVFVDSSTIPGARILRDAARAASPCVRTVMFETWGRRDGGQQCPGTPCSAPFADFDAMQDELTAAYKKIAQALGAEVAPVGEAWRLVRHQHPEIVLFQGDGSHPSNDGTYLAACVFYSKVFGKAPAGLPGQAGVTSPDILQAAAAQAVFAP